jgi:exosome complex RNA-binding protein Rrp42 (RNase PH superfamily)
MSQSASYGSPLQVLVTHEQVGANGKVCGVTKEGFRSMNPSTMMAMLETAQRTGPKLIGGLQKLLEVT